MQRPRTNRGRKRSSRVPAIFRRYPRWPWWIGGVAVVALYIWAFYFFFVSPTGFRWRAIYGEVEYPEGYEIHGIDISHYQGEIDWEQLKNAMIKGCPLRFIIVKSTEGASRIDPNFREYFNQARDYGFIRGVYHFGVTSLLRANRLISSLTRCISLMVTCPLYLTSNISQPTRVWRISNATC